MSPPASWCAHSHEARLRRIHGAPVVTLLGVKSQRFELETPADDLGVHEEGGVASRFCRSCGTHVFEESADWFHQVHVVASTVSEGHWRRPSGHLHWQDRVDWMAFDDDLPRFGGPHGSTPLGHRSLGERLDALHPNVRVAARWDAPDVAALMTALAEAEWSRTPADLAANVAAYLEGDLRGWIFVAEVDRVVVGFCDVKVLPATAEGATQLFVDDLYIAPRARCQGLARALLEVVEAAGREIGAVGASLAARPDGHAASALYERAGWVRQPHDVWERRFSG